MSDICVGVCISTFDCYFSKQLFRPSRSTKRDSVFFLSLSRHEPPLSPGCDVTRVGRRLSLRHRFRLFGRQTASMEYSHLCFSYNNSFVITPVGTRGLRTKCLVR